MAVLRTTISLPETVAKDLAYVASRMGVSQSSLLSEMLAEPLADLRGLMDLVPADQAPTNDQLLRLRGQSANVIAARVKEAIEDLGSATWPPVKRKRKSSVTT